MRFKPKHIFLTSLFIILTAYSIYQARAFLIGPQIYISSHKDGQVVNDRLVTLEGRAKYVAWINLNGHQMFTDEKGNWSEKLLVSEGISIITMKARDRFGRETEKSIRIVLK